MNWLTRLIGLFRQDKEPKCGWCFHPKSAHEPYPIGCLICLESTRDENCDRFVEERE